MENTVFVLINNNQIEYIGQDIASIMGLCHIHKHEKNKTVKLSRHWLTIEQPANCLAPRIEEQKIPKSIWDSSQPISKLEKYLRVACN